MESCSFNPLPHNLKFEQPMRKRYFKKLWGKMENTYSRYSVMISTLSQEYCTVWAILKLSSTIAFSLYQAIILLKRIMKLKHRGPREITLQCYYRFCHDFSPFDYFFQFSWLKYPKFFFNFSNKLENVEAWNWVTRTKRWITKLDFERKKKKPWVHKRPDFQSYTYETW